VPKTHATPKGHYEALVRVVYGDKKLNLMIRNAGLGIDSAGRPEIFRIKYKSGEFVDEARVRAALLNIKEQADADGDVAVVSYDVLGVTFVEEPEIKGGKDVRVR
jgi:hypothetical protein